MAKKVLESILYCKKCERDIMQYKNTKEMSWIMHFILTILTAGIWLMIWLVIGLWHMLTKPIGGKWTCSQCGTKN